MVLTLNVHSSRVSDLIVPDQVFAGPPIPIDAYFDT